MLAALNALPRKAIFLLFLLPAMSGCAGVTALGAANSVLQMTGLGKPKTDPREIKAQLHAGTNLNLSGGQPIAIVTKVYYLKNPVTFSQASMASLLDPAQEKAVLGADLIGVRELTLRPGQSYENVEKVPREATAIAVVAMFHSPATQRWKTVFATEAAEKTGINIGLHACAMSVSAGTPLPLAGQGASDPASISKVRCPA